MKEMAGVGLRVGPRIELSLSKLWDVRQLRVLEWLLFMIGRERVWGCHDGTPCTGYSIAKHPRLRSKEFPWGFNPKDPETKESNWYMIVTFILLRAKLASTFGWATHEHPQSAFSWALPQWKRLMASPVFIDVLTAFCSWGKMNGFLVKKTLRLVGVRAAFLAAVHAPCRGGHQHVPVQGSLTAHTAKYLMPLCRAWAEAAKKQYDAEQPQVSDLDRAAALAQSRPAFENIWMNELITAQSWLVEDVRKEDPGKHINVKELGTAMRAAVRAAEREPRMHH